MPSFRGFTKSKPVRGTMFAAMDTGISVLAQAISLIFVSRILPPDQFAIFAVGAVIVSFTQMVFSPGFTVALIQRSDYKKFFGVAWTYHVLLSIIAYLLLYLSSWWIIESLFPLYLGYLEWYQFMLLTIPLTALSNIGVVQLYKDLNTKLLVLRQGPAGMLKVLSTVGLAYYFRDFRALVFGQFIFILFNLGISYLIAPIQIRVDFSWEKLKVIIPYSIWIHANNLFRVLAQQTDVFFLGRLDQAVFGLYNRGKQISGLCVQITKNANSLVLFPYLSGQNKNTQREQQVFVLSIIGYCCLFLLALAVLYTVGEDSIGVIMGVKWVRSYPFILVFIFSALLGVIRLCLGNILRARGNSRGDFFLTLLEVIFLLILLPILIYTHGVNGACAAIIFAKFASSVGALLLSRNIGLKIARILEFQLLFFVSSALLIWAMRQLYSLCGVEGTWGVLLGMLSSAVLFGAFCFVWIGVYIRLRGQSLATET